MRLDGRADHIEDYLISLRDGPWFSWTDSKNKIYANLIGMMVVLNLQNQIAQMDLLQCKLHGI